MPGQADPAAPTPGAYAANDPCGEQSPLYRYVFQLWMLMFMLVVAVALLSYLASFLPKKRAAVTTVFVERLAS